MAPDTAPVCMFVNYIRALLHAWLSSVMAAAFPGQPNSVGVDLISLHWGCPSSAAF